MHRFLFVSVALLLCHVSAAASSKPKNRHVFTNDQPLLWRSDKQTDVRLEFLSASNLSIELLCDFRSTTGWRGIPNREFQFCFDYGDPALHRCATVTLQKRRSVLKVGGVSADLEYNPMKGASLRLHKIPPEKELPLCYATCQEKSSLGTISSNRLFLLDFRSKFPKTVWRRPEPPQLSKNGPSSLKCLQASLGVEEKVRRSKAPWRQPLVPVTYEWFFCASGAKANLTACEKGKRPLLGLAPFSDWPAQVRDDGQLHSPFVPDKIAKILENKRILCYVMKKLTTFYESPLRIVDNSSAKATSFRMLRPVGMENVTVFGSDYSLTLPCLIDVPKGRHFLFNRQIATFTDEEGTPRFYYGESDGNWRFGVELHRNTSDIRILNVSKVGERREPFHFKCTATSGNTTIFGIYRLVIVTPPRLKSSVPKVVKAIHGQTASVKCLFEKQEDITLGLAVCGKNVNWNNSADVRATQRELNALYKSVLPPLHFEVNITAQDGYDVIEYTETNITFNTDYLAWYHVVTCIATRGMFSNRGWIQFRVQPERPKYSLECNVPTVCDKACNFECEIVNETALVFSSDAKHRISWFLQDNVTDPSWGTDISGEFDLYYFYPYFKPATKRLTASAQILRFNKIELFNVTKSWKVEFRPWITTKERNTIYQCLVAAILVSLAIGGLACFVLSRKKDPEDDEDQESKTELTQA